VPNDPSDFVKLLSTSDAAEIAFIKSLFDEHDIHYFFQGESVSGVYVGVLEATLLVGPDDYERAKSLLEVRPENSIPSDEEDEQTSFLKSPLIKFTKTIKWSFLIGLVIGFGVGYSVVKYKYYKKVYSADRNIDGKVDYWETFYRGQIDSVRMDSNFDGKVDWTISYRNNVSDNYSADINFDGIIDEWGSLKNNQVIEKNNSFNKDQIIDRKIEYKYGKITKKSYDYDRDGVFDEIIFLRSI